MANEWTKIELFGANRDGEPRRYTVATGLSVSKGEVLKLSDPRTAIAKTEAVTDPIAGVASEEKNAGDGTTSIALWTDGIFEAVASDAITIGHPFIGTTSTEQNQITAAALVPGIASGGAVTGAGYALEDAGAAETVNVRLRL